MMKNTIQKENEMSEKKTKQAIEETVSRPLISTIINGEAETTTFNQFYKIIQLEKDDSVVRRCGMNVPVALIEEYPDMLCINPVFNSDKNQLVGTYYVESHRLENDMQLNIANCVLKGLKFEKNSSDALVFCMSSMIDSICLHNSNVKEKLNMVKDIIFYIDDIKLNLKCKEEEMTELVSKISVMMKEKENTYDGIYNGDITLGVVVNQNVECSNLLYSLTDMNTSKSKKKDKDKDAKKKKDKKKNKKKGKK